MQFSKKRTSTRVATAIRNAISYIGHNQKKDVSDLHQYVIGKSNPSESSYKGWGGSYKGSISFMKPRLM
jgi:hypothetical protein